MSAGEASSSEAGGTIRWVESEAELARTFGVMSQLRPALAMEEYIAISRVQQAEGMRIAYLESEGEVVCVANIRLTTMLATGRTLYIEDLVTDAGRRSEGLGGRMLRWLAGYARDGCCRTLSLESGTQRREAHSFYFRHGLRITDFHFQLAL